MNATNTPSSARKIVTLNEWLNPAPVKPEAPEWKLGDVIQFNEDIGRPGTYKLTIITVNGKYVLLQDTTSSVNSMPRKSIKELQDYFKSSCSLVERDGKPYVAAATPAQKPVIKIGQRFLVTYESCGTQELVLVSCGPKQIVLVNPEYGCRHSDAVMLALGEYTYDISEDTFRTLLGSYVNRTQVIVK